MKLFSIFNKKQPEVTSVAEALASASDSSPPKTKSKRAENRHANAQNEQLVPEKKRARRRLIGAIVMVLAMVIGLPMVLDSEPKPVNRNIIIQIPAKESSSINEVKDVAVQDEALESAIKLGQVSDMAEATPANSGVAEPSAAVNKSVSNTKSPTTKSDERQVKTVHSDTKAEVKHSPEHQNDPSSDSVAKKDTPKVATPNGTGTIKPENKAPTQATHSDESNRALAILEGNETSTKAPSKVSPRIVVQVGAFATQEKVNELQSKLASAGIKSFTQKIATSKGDKIRVRIGPFSTKESADKIKLQLEKLGINGNLISL